jgi:phage terminase small subunit
MPKRHTPKGLSDRQQRFVAAYVRCLNASEAARAAGYSAKVANRIGHVLLTKTDISDAIAAALKVVAAAIEMEAKDIVRELSSIGSSDLKDVFDERGCLLPAIVCQRAPVARLPR